MGTFGVGRSMSGPKLQKHITSLWESNISKKKSSEMLQYLAVAGKTGVIWGQHLIAQKCGSAVTERF